MQIEGTVCPMPTPTAGCDPKIDRESLRSYTRFLVDSGVDGLFPCGSIGEFSSLTPEQRRIVFEEVVEAADGSPVLAGCGDTSVESVLGHVENAANAGADAAVVVTPYYLNTTQPGLERFLRTVADRADLPIVLYNIPALTGKCLSRELVTELATRDDVIGIKDTSGDLNYLYDVVRETPDDFFILQGATELAVASLKIGANGMVAGPANVFPGRVSAVFDQHQRGKVDRAQSIMNKVVNPVVSATADPPTAAAIKYLLSLAGHDVGRPLPPLPELTPPERAELESYYERITTLANVQH